MNLKKEQEKLRKNIDVLVQNPKIERFVHAGFYNKIEKIENEIREAEEKIEEKYQKIKLVLIKESVDNNDIDMLFFLFSIDAGFDLNYDEYLPYYRSRLALLSTAKTLKMITFLEKNGLDIEKYKDSSLKSKIEKMVKPLQILSIDYAIKNNIYTGYVTDLVLYNIAQMKEVMTDNPSMIDEQLKVIEYLIDKDAKIEETYLDDFDFRIKDNSEGIGTEYPLLITIRKKLEVKRRGRYWLI